MQQVGGGYKEWAFAKNRAAAHEKSVPYPYLDTRGYLTIGTGAMVPSKEEFVKLDLLYEGKDADNNKISRPATKEEKEAAWDALDPAISKDTEEPHNNKASSYEKKTNIRLSDRENERILDQRLSDARDDAIRHIGEKAWDNLTVGQRAAAIDIAFNVGGLEGYPEFVRAAKAGDAIAMACESLASTDADPNKETDNDHAWERSRDKFCDILGYGPNKCDRAFDGFLGNQTKFRMTTDKARERAMAYVPPPGVVGDESDFSKAENLEFGMMAKEMDARGERDDEATAAPAPRPAPPPKPAVPVQPAGPGTTPASQPQAGPAPRPGQPAQGPGQGPGQAPGQRPAQGPVSPAGVPVPPPPAHGPGRGDERGSLSPEDGFGKLADIPANDVASKDDRDGRQGTPMRMEDYERILGHDVFRDEVAAHMAEPNPEDDGPADKRMQFGINMSLIAHGRMPKYVNGEKAVMAPPRHDIEGKPIKETLAKTSQNFAAMADQIGVIPAVKVTQGALNDLRGPAEPIKEDGEFGPISKETMRDRLFRHGYDKVRMQMQQRYQAMRQQGEERR